MNALQRLGIAPANRKTLLVAAILVFGLGFLAGHLPLGGGHATPPGAPAKSGEKERKIKYWWDPMDPSFISDKPGKSPMGMDMVPVYEDEVDESKAVTINPSVIQNMGVRIVEAKSGPLHKVVRAVGHVDYDETRLYTVSLKMNGWIEKLYADQTGKWIQAGDKLFDIYSPQLVSAQQDYLLQSRRTGGKKSFTQESRTRLDNYDVSPSVIEDLEARGTPAKIVPFYSKYSGILIEKNLVEGDSVSSGMAVLKIADLTKVWVYVHLYESEIAWVRVGQTAIMTLPYQPGKSYSGTVTYIYPYVDKKTRDIAVRLEFPNPDFELKPDMFTNVEIHSQLKDKVTLLPEEAILRSGKDEVVFLATDEKGEFLPVNVRSGLESMDGYVEILEGIKPGDRVVSSGQFMIDTESNLKEAIQKMMKVDSSKPLNEGYNPSMQKEGMEGSGTGTPVPAADSGVAAPAGTPANEGQAVPHADRTPAGEETPSSNSSMEGSDSMKTGGSSLKQDPRSDPGSHPYYQEPPQAESVDLEGSGKIPIDHKGNGHD